jgi:phosphatidylglycerol:prolipoprotein diacylglycerol transferase
MDISLSIAFELGPLTVRWYGIIIACAMSFGIYLAYKETLRQRQDDEHLLNMLLLLIPAAIIGARLYYVLFNPEQYLANPGRIFATWTGGMAIHGGVIAGVLVVIIYTRLKKMDFFRWADILAPSLILGQAIGRWGNFTNHEAYGPVIAEGSFWGWMPLQVYANGAYHHPTFLYESIWNLVIFIFLFWLIRREHRIGSVFASYLIGYSLGRFFIETLRQDSLMIGGLRTAQIVSLILIALGLAILYYIRSREKVDVTCMQTAGKKRRKLRQGK